MRRSASLKELFHSIRAFHLGTRFSVSPFTIPADPSRHSIALDPYTDVYLHFQSQAYFQLGRYERAVEVLKRRLTRHPDTDISRVLLAASFGHLGRTDEARAQWQEVFRINPNYSLEHRRKVLPYKNPADFELVVEGLRKAGIEP